MSALAFFLLAQGVVAKNNLGHLGYDPYAIDPFADPAHDILNPLRYIANNTLTGIATGTHFLCIAAFATGLALRFGMHKNPRSKGIYIAEYLFVVLSPCAFIASEYVLAGRVARFLQAEKYLLVNPRKITRIFVSSDITTFLIQAVGGAVSLSANDTKLNLAGSRVFLAGLALQLLSFLIFTVIFTVFMWRIRTHSPEIWNKDQGVVWHRDWRALAVVMVISCIGVLIRSVFRVVELSEGYQGALTRSEPLFYALDTLPLFIAILVYCPPFFPGQFIPSSLPEESKEVVDEASQ
ncbi:RTA1-like protein [Flagelloscypha sp. PMI_526]|nr:RTA1-like protein [Flagelloscypha sp. PMI_526]